MIYVYEIRVLVLYVRSENAYLVSSPDTELWLH